MRSNKPGKPSRTHRSLLKTKSLRRAPYKRIFTTFKSRTNNGDIAELYTTASWDSPVHEESHTTDSDQEILRELRRYYVWLYSEKPSLDNETPIKALRERPLQQSDIELMERPVTLYECKQAIRRLGLAKAAGPDGLPAEFYRSFEELVVKDLHNTLQEAHTLGVFPRSKGHRTPIQKRRFA
jgi:hypothetical protein